MLDLERDLEFAGEDLVLLALYVLQGYDDAFPQAALQELHERPGRGERIRIGLAVHQYGQLVVALQERVEPGEFFRGPLAAQQVAEV